MRRMIYASRATHDFSAEELVALLSTARERNAADGLSGMLLYASQSFLQLLEGGHDAVASTFARISADPRHTHLRVLADREADAPLFPDWSMGFDHVDDEELADELDGYTPASEYPLVNPDLIANGTVAQTLLTLYARNRVR